MSVYLCKQPSNDFMRLKIITLELIIVNSQDVFEYFVGSEQSAYLHDDNNKEICKNGKYNQKKNKQPRTQNPSITS